MWLNTQYKPRCIVYAIHCSVHCVKISLAVLICWTHPDSFDMLNPPGQPQAESHRQHQILLSAGSPKQSQARLCAQLFKVCCGDLIVGLIVACHLYNLMETTSSTGPCSLGGICIKAVCSVNLSMISRFSVSFWYFFYDDSFYSNEDPLICTCKRCCCWWKIRKLQCFFLHQVLISSLLKTLLTGCNEKNSLRYSALLLVWSWRASFARNHLFSSKCESTLLFLKLANLPLLKKWDF